MVRPFAFAFSTGHRHHHVTGLACSARPQIIHVYYVDVDLDPSAPVPTSHALPRKNALPTAQVNHLLQSRARCHTATTSIYPVLASSLCKSWPRCLHTGFGAFTIFYIISILVFSTALLYTTHGRCLGSMHLVLFRLKAGNMQILKVHVTIRSIPSYSLAWSPISSS